MGGQKEPGMKIIVGLDIVGFFFWYSGLKVGSRPAREGSLN